MDADAWRLQAQTAMHEQGTLLEIARIILAFAADMDDLTRENLPRDSRTPPLRPLRHIPVAKGSVAR